MEYLETKPCSTFCKTANISKLDVFNYSFYLIENGFLTVFTNNENVYIFLNLLNSLREFRTKKIFESTFLRFNEIY